MIEQKTETKNIYLPLGDYTSKMFVGHPPI